MEPVEPTPLYGRIYAVDSGQGDSDMYPVYVVNARCSGRDLALLQPTFPRKQIDIAALLFVDSGGRVIALLQPDATGHHVGFIEGNSGRTRTVLR